MNEPESSKASGPPRTRGMRKVRAEGSPLNRQVLILLLMGREQKQSEQKGGGA